ncbi:MULTISPECIES: alpha/beta fold hydrolase [Actinoalloteichus]|uniref:Hydrolase or acyltransferase of alpha/beta superfamily n=1 Tax=Actinoalloteichus fjordicus TaxID=1612552 RepID=A0AAC9PSS8_9PSEU|nr:MULTISPECIES: alpha/beta fold hydrolase [Actinoalloteichus]APU15141.1 putative hydrolase or acyltransferase of alpha/beta superfamily [Actinoalloteichus fjordicus]APU21209.1 putative hydrolase or acyltransferase of alpha/beta superfamily [Actinoalloteichus sp. GBA129-24]
MNRVAVNGTELAYDEAGSGNAVVFSHAGITDRRLWDAQFERLAADHRVIRYDWRGYGESADADGGFSHAEDLLALLDALDVERAALVGCSNGGAYSLDVALAAPERVWSLTLICSGLSGHHWPEEMRASARERVHSAVPAERLRAYNERQAPHVDPADVTAMALAQARFLVAGPDRDPAALAPDVWAAAVAMIEGVFARTWNGPPTLERPHPAPAKPRLDQVRVPTLVVNGTADVRWIQAVSTMLAEQIPGARRLDLPDTGHLPPLERPEEVTSALLDFLAETSPS